MATLGGGGGGLISGFSALTAALNFTATEAAALAPVLGQVADAAAKLAAANKQLAADTQFAKEQAAGHARAVENTSAAIASAAYNTTVYSAALLGNSADTQDGIAVYGQATSAALTLTAATAAQTKALTDLLTTQKLYTASLQNALTIVPEWNDYLANLVDAYKSGAAGILQYKTALEDFLHVLETQFATATGKAKDALQSMIATVQTLINTAGAGGQGAPDTSYGGALNKAFNKP
jgi:hypothetical protein